MRFLSRHLPILAVLSAGLILRLVLAYVAFPNQGYTTDLTLFARWTEALAAGGPGSVYAATGANYPPGYLWILWLVGSATGPLSSLLGQSQADTIVLLLKLPAILADVAIAALVYTAGRRWLGLWPGLLGAALYLFVPVTWIDSAMWGQVDAVGAVVALAAIVALAEGLSEVATALAVLAILVKLQDGIALAVVVPVLIRRHLLLPALDRDHGRVAALLSRRGAIRLVSSALAAVAVGILALLPFDIARYAPASLAGLPVVGQVAGLISLFVTLGNQFPVLTANAYNAWSLVGPNSLASSVGTSGASWTLDSLQLPGGFAASTAGAVLLLGVTALVAAGLLRRDGKLTIVLGLALLALAFYALPTRVHERYLVPFFAPAALLAGTGATWVASYVAMAIANAANLLAVLAGSLSIGLPGGRFGGGSGPGDRGGFGPSLGGDGGPAGFGSNGFAGLAQSFGSVQLPWADILRSETVVAAIALGQTIALVALVGVWIVVVTRPSHEPTRAQRVLTNGAGSEMLSAS